MTRRTRRPASSNMDSRWKLVDGLFSKLLDVVLYLGLPPKEVAEHVQTLLNGLATSGPDDNFPLADTAAFDAVYKGSVWVMHTWFHDLDFLDQSGKPRSLPFDKPSPSFSDLVRRGHTGITPRTALESLLAAGSVKMNKDELIEPISHAVIFDSALMRAAVGLYAAENLLSSVKNNVHASSSNDGLFQREAVCQRFDVKQLPRSNRYLRQQCLDNLERIDNWLHQHEIPASGSRKTATVIVGTYVAIRDEKSKRRSK